MTRFLYSLVLLALTIAPKLVAAQTTGSFDTSIAFMSGTRQLSLYVPPSYTPANKYRLMVCLHGLGDSCVTYRNGLINTLGWGTNIPATIFVCPEAVTKSSDFYSAPGTETIIQQSIAVAMAKYHIDTANVVLQGFSLGGRAALRYGLDNPGVFKGLLLNTPAIQGVKEALNGRAPAYSFNYANASQVPIYITRGANDQPYASSIDSTYEQLVRNNGKLRYFEVPGLGHTIPPINQMMNFISFFNAPAHVGRDVEAVRFYPTPFLACNTPATATLLFRNAGEDTLHSVKFKYTLGGLTQWGIWAGTLLPFQHATFTALFTNPVAGTNSVAIQVDSINGTTADTVLANNQRTARLHYANSPLASLNEGFEGSTFPPAGWVLEQGGDFYTAWEADNTVAKSGSQSAFTFNTILLFDNAGRQEGLITPVVTVPTVNPRLSFDVTFNYHRYTPPYFTTTTDFADTLEVLVSTDCGANYTSLYKKGGANLATFASPILNALSIPAAWGDSPADSNWRSEQIDLSSILGGTNPVNARFKFSYRSGIGGSINIDNVRVTTAASVSPQQIAPNYSVYPNPADKMVIIERAQGSTVTLNNAIGQVVLTQKIASNQEHIGLADLPSGVYLLTLTEEAGTKSTIRVVKR